MFESTVEKFLASSKSEPFRGEVKLLLTSPPFPLRAKKAYGNLEGQEYLDWISDVLTEASEMLTPDGSMVIEIGNAWEPGIPAMSTLPLRALLAIADKTGFHVCQQFICHNPARLPGPAQWVTVNRLRAKDSYTHVWWFAKSPWVPADNRRIQKPYSKGMEKLLKKQKYNSGLRPSDHKINDTSFLNDNGGAIPANVLEFANTSDDPKYVQWCKANDWRPHPARMPAALASFFIEFLTDEGELIFDCFGGSLTTASVAQRLNRRRISTEPTEEYLLASLGRFAGEKGLVAQNEPYVENLHSMREWHRENG